MSAVGRGATFVLSLPLFGGDPNDIADPPSFSDVLTDPCRRAP